MYIVLNTRGNEIFPHLIGEKLQVYGYNHDSYSFIVWDKIVGMWCHVPEHCCEGVN